MMELAGIDMLPPEAGIPWIRRELTAGARCGEVVAGDRLGVLLNEWDAAGGLDTVALQQSAAGPMTGEGDGHGRTSRPDHRDHARPGACSRSCTITRSKARPCCPA